MGRFLIENLEEYLAGQLGERRRREFEERLARRPKDRKTVERMQSVSGMFGALDLPSGCESGPSPGFHLRVLGCIRRQRPVSVWEVLSRPFVLRTAALAACTCLVAVVGAGFYRSSAQPVPENIAQSVLSLPPESADYCNVRLGCDIDLNRSTMLAVVLEAGAGRR